MGYAQALASKTSRRHVPGASAEMSPSSTVDPLAGTVLSGQFRLVDRLASGGMGTVYSAEQLDANNRLVAVKLLELPKTLTAEAQAGTFLTSG